MKRIVLGGLAALLLSVVGVARAQGIDGQVTATWNPTTTTLEALSLTGRPEFKIDGHYYQATGEFRLHKVVLYGAYQFGRSKRIEGGLDPTSPHFNVMSGEKSEITDVVLGYQVLDTPLTGKLDLGVGYMRIYDDADISPPAWYTGNSVSLRGHRLFANGFGADYRVVYVPDFSAHGSVAPVLEGKSILHYRLAVDYVFSNSWGITAGYQDYNIKADVKFDGSEVVIHPRGAFGGIFYRF